MKIKILEVAGLEWAMKGARKAFNSEHKIDSVFDHDVVYLGKNDKSLLLKLIKAGNSHAKCMRFVEAYFEITAARYWWQQFDTYKIGVERLSQSTMHTIMKRPLDYGDFQDGEIYISFDQIERINHSINKGNFEEVKKILPESFLQTRMVKANYQALRNMYFDRRHHKLKEWEQFCDYLKLLPLAEFITVERK